MSRWMILIMLCHPNWTTSSLNWCLDRFNRLWSNKQKEDLYDLLPRENTAYCERVWKKCWERQIEKTGKPPSVWKLMFDCAGREMIMSFVVFPIWLISVCGQVILSLSGTNATFHLFTTEGYVPFLYKILLVGNFRLFNLNELISMISFWDKKYGEIWSSWLWAVCWSIIHSEQVYVLKAIVLVAGHRDEHLTWWRGFILVFGMFMTSNFQSISMHHCFTAGERAGSKIRNGVATAVFNKVRALGTKKTTLFVSTAGGHLRAVRYRQGK